MKNLFSAIALVLLSWTASAQAAPQPLWVCGLQFQGRAEGVKFIIGKFETHATGTLHCVGIDGQQYSRSVSISMGHSFLSPSIGIGDYEFVGASAGISLFTCNPDHLLGSYLVEGGRASIIGGVGAFVAEKLNPPQLAVSVQLQLLHGVGFDVGIHKMTISGN